MKKMIFAFAALVAFINFVSAQAYEGTTEYKKKKRNAIIIEYPNPPDAVENAISQKMQKLGYRGKDEKGLFNGDKGFTVYSHAYIADISEEPLDYIIKVERKSKKQDDQSIVYMIAMKGDSDGSTVLNDDGIAKAKAFLNNFTPDVEAAHLEIKINDQQDALTKAEKKLKKLQDDQSDLESKIKKLQDELTSNAKDQVDAGRDIDNQKQTLENLKLRRKS